MTLVSQDKLPITFQVEMRQDARANAAISILDNFLVGQNLNSVLSRWAKNNRYAGSSDRESIRNIVFDILRVKKTFASLLEKEKQAINGRKLVFLYSVFYSLQLNDIFTGQKYGPSKLNIDEILEGPICHEGFKRLN